MPRPIKFTYEKKAPCRDAFYLIIVCEGTNREREYFEFFNGISSRVKVVPVVSRAGSAPKLLVDVAETVGKALGVRDGLDRIWFVIDTDRWRTQLHDIRHECSLRRHWEVAQSNPCFEVWLYFHAKAQLPELNDITQCRYWKPFLPEVIPGGFNSDFHPIAIETAIVNAKATCQETGYLPAPGSTQVWRIGEELLPFVKKDLDKLKPCYPTP